MQERQWRSPAQEELLARSRLALEDAELALMERLDLVTSFHAWTLYARFYREWVR